MWAPAPKRRIVIVACCAALLLVSACSGLGGPSAVQATGPTVNCRALARHGVRICPPADPTLDHPQMINHAKNMVSEKQFKRYAQGLLRNLAYEGFALDTSQASLLRLGVLATPHATNLVYSQDFDTIDFAKQQGAKLTTVDARTTTIKLVTLPHVDQGYIKADGYVPTDLAWVVTAVGPAWTYTTKGSSFTLAASGSVNGSQLFWGSYHATSKLGPMWTFDGSTPCDSAGAWQAVCDE